MRMSSLQLKRLIESEVNGVMESKRRSKRRPVRESSFRPSLLSVIFEDAAEDLDKWMKTPLSSHGANPVSKLPADAAELVKKGLDDGNQEDDKQITGSTEGEGNFIAVTKVFASQNEVGMKQSLANVCGGVDATWDGIDWGDVDWLLQAMQPGAQIAFSSPILGATVKEGTVVLDGHHRWSQAFMVNPTAQVNVVLLNAGNMSADEALKAVHLAILAKTGKSDTKKASGGNLFKAGKSDIEGYLEGSQRKVDPKTGEPSPSGVAPYIRAVMLLNKIDDVEEGKTAAVERLLSAIQTCNATVVSGAPSRDAMPQADNETNPITAADAAAALNSGEVNYNAPFSSDGSSSSKDEKQQVTADSWNRQGTVMVERWQRLAGLIRD